MENKKTMNPESKPETEAPTQPSPPVGRRRRGASHVTMREEFLSLFRDTSRPSSHEPGTATRKRPLAPAPEPSRFLRRFLQRGVPQPEAASSGLARLDHHLGGGFVCGLHLVLGLPGAGKTAFLESLAWEAVSHQRPVIYYALKSGGLQVWEHFVITLAAILDEPAVTREVLRAHELARENVEALRRLDAALQDSVLPYVSLVDATPASTRSASVMIEDVRSRTQEAVGEHERLPLILIDDLQHLLTLTGSRSPSDLLARFDDAFTAESITGLVAAAPADLARGGTERRLAARTVLVLTPGGSSPGGSAASDTPEQVELEVRKNMITGWTGTVPLLLDRRSGLFAEPEARG
jgi:AAA domain